VQSELAGLTLTLTQEASYEEWEGARKIVQHRTLPKRSGSSKSAAKNLPILPGPTLKKAKNKHTLPITVFYLFIEVLQESCKHTPPYMPDIQLFRKSRTDQMPCIGHTLKMVPDCKFSK
jgi:hypothetical protein